MTWARSPSHGSGLGRSARRTDPPAQSRQRFWSSHFRISWPTQEPVPPPIAAPIGPPTTAPTTPPTAPPTAAPTYRSSLRSFLDATGLLLALARAVVRRANELVALARLRRRRQSVPFNAGHLLARVSPSGADHVVQARRGSGLAWFATALLRWHSWPPSLRRCGPGSLAGDARVVPRMAPAVAGHRHGIAALPEGGGPIPPRPLSRRYRCGVGRVGQERSQTHGTRPGARPYSPTSGGATSRASGARRARREVHCGRSSHGGADVPQPVVTRLVGKAARRINRANIPRPSSPRR